MIGNENVKSFGDERRRVVDDVPWWVWIGNGLVGFVLVIVMISDVKNFIRARAEKRRWEE